MRLFDSSELGKPLIFKTVLFPVLSSTHALIESVHIPMDINTLFNSLKQSNAKFPYDCMLTVHRLAEWMYTKVLDHG